MTDDSEIKPTIKNILDQLAILAKRTINEEINEEINEIHNEIYNDN